MIRITFRAPESLIDAARELAERKQSKLNAEFQVWLEEFAQAQLFQQKTMLPDSNNSIQNLVQR